ncbi:hypothetical protein IAQ61_007131 [Plenodomus lingam]|uniref:uncharacterized protein n=1 Tax=Leptosphaeria maculans TaxID=5022 RepID=UPI003330DECD|nr:hypothetical protein IAQ61_007131 [Plenodomus lingam]
MSPTDQINYEPFSNTIQAYMPCTTNPTPTQHKRKTMRIQSIHLLTHQQFAPHIASQENTRHFSSHPATTNPQPQLSQSALKRYILPD